MNMTAIGIITNYIWYALHEFECTTPHMGDPNEGTMLVKKGRKQFKVTIEEIK